MPDICALILEEHATFRHRFAEIDVKRGEHAGADVLRRLWEPLAELLDRHADAEEEVFYPDLLRRGAEGNDETDDAIRDHNHIRDAVRDAAGREAGADDWWEAVDRARKENSEHMAEEERGPLADFRVHTEASLRESLGARFLVFSADHAGGRGVSGDDKDPGSYIRDHTRE